MYSIGETEKAVRFFLGLLRSSDSSTLSAGPGSYDITLNGAVEPALKTSEEEEKSNFDKVFLEDFRLAYQHLLSTAAPEAILGDLKLPFPLSSPKDSKVRLSDDHLKADATVWEEHEQQWNKFWKNKGKEKLESRGKAFTGGNVFYSCEIY